MQFLKLSAADCGKAAEAHSQLLMSIGKSSARGLPGGVAQASMQGFPNSRFGA